MNNKQARESTRKRREEHGVRIYYSDCSICGRLFVHRKPGRKYCGSNVCRNKSNHQSRNRATLLEQKRRANKIRHARRRTNSVVDSFDYLTVYERDGWRCGLCGKRVGRRIKFPHPRSATLDHVVPLSEGGGHTMANVQCAHYSCNSAKNNRLLAQGEQLRLIG